MLKRFKSRPYLVPRNNQLFFGLGREKTGVIVGVFLKFRSICTEEMDHTFSQLISMILPVLSDGPKWRQVASREVRNYYEKDQLQI